MGLGRRWPSGLGRRWPLGLGAHNAQSRAASLLRFAPPLLALRRLSGSARTCPCRSPSRRRTSAGVSEGRKAASSRERASACSARAKWERAEGGTGRSGIERTQLGLAAARSTCQRAMHEGRRASRATSAPGLGVMATAAPRLRSLAGFAYQRVTLQAGADVLPCGQHQLGAVLSRRVRFIPVVRQSVHAHTRPGYHAHTPTHALMRTRTHARARTHAPGSTYAHRPRTRRGGPSR